jgi:hypothetical protein
MAGAGLKLSMSRRPRSFIRLRYLMGWRYRLWSYWRSTGVGGSRILIRRGGRGTLEGRSLIRRKLRQCWVGNMICRLCCMEILCYLFLPALWSTDLNVVSPDSFDLGIDYHALRRNDTRDSEVTSNLKCSQVTECEFSGAKIDAKLASQIDIYKSTANVQRELIRSLPVTWFSQNPNRLEPTSPRLMPHQPISSQRRSHHEHSREETAEELER